MFKQTFVGAILAMVVAPTGMKLASVMDTTKTQQTAENSQLAESIANLSRTLVSFESRQTGSERGLTEQLKALTQIVSDTQRANQRQIDQLAASLLEVKQVAAQEKESFDDILKDFKSSVEKQLVKAEAETEEAPKEGVGTLDVNNAPSADDGRPENFADAARRIVELEKAVKELQSRSVSSATPASTVSYEPTYYYGTVSGGCTGGYAVSGGCTGSSVVKSSSYTPTYYYSTSPAKATTYNYTQPSTVVQRRGVFRSSTTATNGTCRVVNGRVICN